MPPSRPAKFQDPTGRLDHRPWPLPAGPWIMQQQWRDLLFMHWPVPVDAMRALVPPALELDLFDGVAWVAVVPFRMTGVRPRGVPSLPWISAFPELNVRTYVRSREPRNPKPGVYFFSLEAANALAVWAARTFFKLPYFNAEMTCDLDGEQINYRSTRTHRQAAPARFASTYRPTGAPYLANPGTLEHWLTERYSLYTVDERGQAYIGEIHHEPWPLQRAEAEIECNEMGLASGIMLPDRPPLLHFARHLDVVVWPLRAVTAENT
ncbi:MAG: DUF2071 domain-containing protein [Myxococcales bacterium]|nr:DUF2071 domain-containing protein [Myxococcales bacterium]